MGDTTADFQAVQRAARHNPDLPLTWQQVIQLDKSLDADPAKKQELIGSLERIQASQTGQQELRDILLGHDKPVTVAVRADGAGGGNYIDDPQNGIHRLELHTGLFGHHWEPTELRRSFDQVLVHELGHGAAPLELPPGAIQTNEDSLFWHGKDEKAAEDFRKRYDEENHLPHGPYTREPDTEQELNSEQYRRLSDTDKENANKGLAAGLAGGSILADLVEGKSMAEAKANLKHKVDQIKQITGVDLEGAVDEYLESPAPAEERTPEPSAPAALNSQSVPPGLRAPPAPQP